MLAYIYIYICICICICIHRWHFRLLQHQQKFALILEASCNCNSNLLQLHALHELCAATKFHAITRFAVSVHVLSEIWSPPYKSIGLSLRVAPANTTVTCCGSPIRYMGQAHRSPMQLAWKIMCNLYLCNYWERCKCATSLGHLTSFNFRGVRPSNPLSREVALESHWGLHPTNPIIGSHYRAHRVNPDGQIKPCNEVTPKEASNTSAVS